MALLTVCLGASVVLLLHERQKTGQVSDQLVDLDHRTATRSSELQQQINEARARAESLDAALSQAREQLGRNDDQHRADAAAAEDAAATLRTERQQAAAVVDKLADTERRSAAQVTDLQHRLELEQAKAGDLDRNLADVRRQLAQTDDLRRSAAASARAAEAAVQSGDRQASALAEKLAEAERRATADTQHLQEQVEAEHAKAASLEAELSDARLKLAQAATLPDDLPPEDTRSAALPLIAEADRPPTDKPAPAKSAAPSTTAAPAQPVAPATAAAPAPRSEAPAPELALATPPTSQSPAAPAAGMPSDAVPARIVLRYASGSESAKARAQFAELLLQEQGLRIEDHAAPAKGLSASRVSFYYKEDQAIAKIIADALVRITGSDTVQKLPMSLKTLPRPGTIEVAISG